MATMQTLFDAVIAATRAEPKLGHVNVGFERAILKFELMHPVSEGGLVGEIVGATAVADEEALTVTYTIRLGDPAVLAEMTDPRPKD